ncbi:hypothetical protein ACFL2D_01170 [Patescibacteria group bacterium]
MEKKLFIAAGALVVVAIIFAVLFFMTRDPGSRDSTDINDDSIVDSDNDRLTNMEEAEAGTDPKKADTDGDSLSDYEEIKQHKTNPLSQDTDGDGYSDGTEVRGGFNPLE